MESPNEVAIRETAETALTASQVPLKLASLTIIALPNLIGGATKRPETLLSLGSIFFSAFFLLIGWLLMYKLHDPTMPFFFFPMAYAIMLFYAFVYSLYLNSEYVDRTDSYGRLKKKARQAHFDGGRISARWVMRFLFYLTSLSFLGAGIYMQTWLGATTNYFGWIIACYVIASPISVTFLSLVYGVYVAKNQVDVISWSRVKRTGTAAQAIGTVSFLTLLASLASTGCVLLTYTWSNIWLSMVATLLSFFVSLGVLIAYKRFESEDADRGVKPEGTSR